MAGFWPFTGTSKQEKDEVKTNSLNDYIKSLIDETESIKSKLAETRLELKQAKMDLAESNEGVMKAVLAETERVDGLAKTISSSVKTYIDFCKSKPQSDTIIQLEKENKQLKAQVKRLKTSLKTFTTMLDTDSQFKEINDIIDKISVFLDEEDNMFVKEVREPLENNNYYENIEVGDKITAKDLVDITDIIIYHDKDAISGDVIDHINSIIKKMFINGKYSKFVRRSVAMNNKTKDFIQDIKDMLCKLDENMTNELVKLKLENKELKNKILLLADDDSSKTISKLQQEISGLKIENEALRYKGGMNRE